MRISTVETVERIAMDYYKQEIEAEEQQKPRPAIPLLKADDQHGFSKRDPTIDKKAAIFKVIFLEPQKWENATHAIDVFIDGAFLSLAFDKFFRTSQKMSSNKLFFCQLLKALNNRCFFRSGTTSDKTCLLCNLCAWWRTSVTRLILMSNSFRTELLQQVRAAVSSSVCRIQSREIR